MNKKKVAIIGLGNWSKKMLSYFNLVSDVKYCCTTGRKKNIDWLKLNFPNILHTKDLTEVLTDSDIEVVIIATPIVSHFDLAKKALNSEKHVFLEKPASNKSVEVKYLEELAKSKKKYLFVDQVFSYDENYIILRKKLINERIISINCQWNKWGTFKENIVWNLLYHDLYLLNILIDKFSIKEFYKKIIFNNYVNVSFRLGSNEKISIKINRMSLFKKKVFRIKTDKSEYTWTNNKLFMNENGRDILLNKNDNLNIKRMIKDFFVQINDGKTGINSRLPLKTCELTEYFLDEI